MTFIVGVGPWRERMMNAAIWTVAIVCIFQTVRITFSLHSNNQGIVKSDESSFKADRTSTSGQCVSAYSDLKDLIESAEQLILTMPAKAAGSSLKQFVEKCNGPEYSQLRTNFLGAAGNYDFKKNYPQILTNSLVMPPVVASHLRSSDEPFIHLIRNMPTSNLIIYFHREEHSRLRSAIKHAVVARAPLHNDMHYIFERIDDNKYFLEERTLFSLILKRYGEMSPGTYDLLSCETYQAIDDYAPNMAFVDYRDANFVQKLIAEKHCPDLVGEVVETNAAESVQNEAFVLVNNSSTGGVSEVPLDVWLDGKMSSLEWALGLNDGATCVGKTRAMETELSLCNSGFLMSRGSVADF